MNKIHIFDVTLTSPSREMESVFRSKDTEVSLSTRLQSGDSFMARY